MGPTIRPTGTVTFADTTTGRTLGTGRLSVGLGNCAAAGLVTAFRTTGPHTVTAVYGGDSVYLGDSADPESTIVTVNP
ncbi:Ig-like domain repeat protein [Streptacidiphilus melanogenes]|uniref:Ig-like domain repeat protein n=1 Tax=Streptacidiphilus melanogenes TaxID=411235 RepID=UPI0005A8EFB1|nr:Ig-like domain repeat protein [Streptacidiphilus melanogenes]